MNQPRSFWMLECVSDSLRRWVALDDGRLTNDPHDAVQFCRREDAEFMAEHLPSYGLLKATEHVWVEPRDIP